jgi:glucokinase
MDVTQTPQAEVADALGRLVGGVLSETNGPVLGAALALSGIVDAGRLGYAPGLQWPDRDATAMLRTAVGPRLASDASLVVENEARFAAVGEQRYGAAAGVGDFVYLLGEVGVGAGVVADGRLFRGTRGAAGEVGHVSIAMEGRRCSCGKTGCWATYVGQGELVRLVLLARADGEASSLWPAGPDQPRAPALEPSEVVAAARGGDAVAQRALAVVRRALAAGIGNLVSSYDPELVVLGGFLAAAFGEDLTTLRAEVDDWVMGGGIHTELRLEASGIRGASLLGGIALVHDHVVQAPRPD